MDVALPACITAGVALVSAGIIVATPATPRHSDVQVPAVQLFGVEGVDPMAGWIDVLPEPPVNFETLGTDLLEPAPPPAAGELPPTMTAPFPDFSIDLGGIFGGPGNPANDPTAAINGP